MSIRSGHIVAAVAICLVSAGIARSAEETPVAGIWRGESLCTGSSGSCHNETVVYYIEDIPGQPNLVTIRADKIIDGKAVTMGTGQWTHDRTRHTLEWRTSERVWMLVVNGNQIAGTLTLADQSVVRKMTLKKDK